MLHPEIVDLSAHRYVDYLGELMGRATLSNTARDAIGALQQSLTTALELRGSLSPADIPFTA